MGAAMSIEENRKRYEGSNIQALMESCGHTICDRCYCCDATAGSAPCWQCGGFEPNYDDEWDIEVCSVCSGEGEIYFMHCLGNCDIEGNHHKTERSNQ
jgi:hypothetical protein